MDSHMDMASGGPSSSSLADLLQQSRKLTTHLSGSRSDLPSIQLGLDQIESQSRKLALARSQAASAAAAGNDAKAHYFLANAGIDAGNLAETINQANIAEAFEPLQPIYDTDVDVGALLSVILNAVNPAFMLLYTVIPPTHSRAGHPSRH